MAKKKEKNDVKQNEWSELLVAKIEALEQRINRIVHAIDKSKSVRKL